MKQPLTIQANTLGVIAKQYNIDVRVLWDMIKANEALKMEIEKYTNGVERKASKLLPPIVVGLIYTTLGEP